ncbi:MAG: potassium/proton antiporter [Phycisphaerae bacterium]|nr:potassium/proton antiporter [Phycisphaerae bacterium]
MTLALIEPNATALLLLVLAALLFASVLFTRPLNRFGIPVVLLFLILGMLGGSEGIGGIAFDDFALAFRLGTIALILILFDGGLNTSVQSIRASAGPAGVLATVGVAGTALVLSFIGRWIGLPWSEAVLIGVIVSSTDAAAVLAVLRGSNLRLKPRVRSVLEVESCMNDPMAVILTISVIEILQHASYSVWGILLSVIVQLVIGAVMGALVGYASRAILTRMVPTTGALFAVATIAAGFLSFGLTTVAAGSGFLAVFVTGVVLGNEQLPFRIGLARVHDALAWLSQIGMFLMLGLLVFPSRLLPVAGAGLSLGLALAFIARPLIVYLCLLPFRTPFHRSLFIGWVGLRGAVPIVLATIPAIAGLPVADRVFHITFFIVVVSTLVPGASITWLARRLGLEVPERPSPAAVLEINSLRQLDGEIRAYTIDPSLAVCDASLADIEFPEGSAAVLLIRGTELIAARGSTILRPGDHLYIFSKPAHRPLIELLFGGPENEDIQNP